MCSHIDREVKGPIERTTRCQNCNEMFAREELHWVSDRYGIPFKLVCDDCYDEVKEGIMEYEFDPSTGEHLDPEDREA